MHCPIDGSQLVMTERSGVEIDYCPQCRGVWLDRGELDKIIERSVQAPPPPPPPPQRSFSGHDHRRDEDDYGHAPRRKKRGGFLDELFDF